MARAEFQDASISLTRDEQGVLHLLAPDDAGLYRALGLAHGTDRAMQLLFMRVLGQGRAAECLDASLLAVDRFFRKVNWTAGLDAEVGKLSPASRAFLEAYTQGINEALSRSVPWEFKLLRYRPEPWHARDSVLVGRMIGYLTLAQSQGELERLIVELVQQGLTSELLESLFPGKLEGLDPELLRKVRLEEHFLPESVKAVAGSLRMMASNNWVVSGSRTKSGKPLLANDPHLEVNRLPAVWYEVAAATPTRSVVSATMPGVPGFLVGRTEDLAWGATYTFADAIDSWVEEVRDGKLRREHGWEVPQKRVETIRVKGRRDEEAIFWDTAEHGVLDAAPTEDGFVLSTRWAGADAGAPSFEGIFGMFHARTVEEGQRHIGRLEASFNWVLADAAGHIGYQMSGRIPLRRAGWSGLVPVPGWESRNDWQGFATVEQLPRVVDPEAGFFVTANNDLNAFGILSPINVSMGAYRSERIEQLLDASEALTVDDLERFQLDLHSTQAERFLTLLRPLLPPDETVLRHWDLRYDVNSLGAERFERFYRALFRNVFSSRLGPRAVGFLDDETGIFTDFYASFDRVLLAEHSPWFGPEKSRDDWYREALQEALAEPPRPWGERRRVVFAHLLLGGKLPTWLGFDVGPMALPGGRATPCQGQIYRSAQRTTTFAPSFRMVTDFAEPVSWRSALAGGPSDRRFSRWYTEDLKRWMAGERKVVTARL